MRFAYFCNFMKAIAILFGLLVMSISAMAQEDPTVNTSQDSLIVESQDTVLLKSYAKRYNPRKALLLAAVLPGLGQIYNRKYWKVPLVWGGLYATGYAIDQYNTQNKEYRSVLYWALENGVGETEIRGRMLTTTKGYRNAIDKSQRERDLMIIVMGLVYVLQIVDAHVDAHLKEFDLNPRLQVKLEPLLEQDMLIGRQSGISLKIKL
jgi:hypothetical protein